MERAHVGDGGGIWSWIHIDDAADATAVALERGAAGIYTSSTKARARPGAALANLARRLP